MFAGFGTAIDTNRRFHELLARGQRRPLDRVRPADADGPRLRRRARARRGRQVRRRGRHARRRRRPLPRHRPRRGHHVDDDQRPRRGDLRDVRRERGSERRRAGAARRHAAERHPEGVPGAEGVHLPAAPVVAARRATRCAFCAAEMPRWHPISISGYHIREAGSTAAQELAFTVANGFAYVELGLAAGLDVDAFAPRLSFFFNAHIDFFEEIAKYRAARRIWARWMRDRYGAQRERSLQMRFHTQTAGVSLTAQQPEVNIVRTAIEALAGVLGGTQSLHTNSMDETLALPTEKAARIALRTQQVIANETRVDQRRRSARRVVVRRGAHRRDRTPGRGALRAHRRAGRRLDARRRGPRRRGGLVPGRDRRRRVRARTQAQRAAGTWSSA